MAKNKKHITSDNVTEWLSSTGFLFPRNEIELARFEKLFGKVDEDITGEEIDPTRIIKGEDYTSSQGPRQQLHIEENDKQKYSNLSMAARKGDKIPDYILKKMKKNQENSNKKDDRDSEEERNV